jgi:23S rRNA pseudouridine2605 synthase
MKKNFSRGKDAGSNGFDKKRTGGKERKSYGDKPERNSERGERGYSRDDKPREERSDRRSGDNRGKSYGEDRPKRFSRDNDGKSYGSDKPKRFGDRDNKGYSRDNRRSSEGEDRPKRFNRDNDGKSYGSDKPKRFGDRDNKGYSRDNRRSSEGEDRPKRFSRDNEGKSYGDKPRRFSDDEKGSRGYSRDRKDGDDRKRSFNSDRPKKFGDRDKPFDKKGSFKKDEESEKKRFNINLHEKKRPSHLDDDDIIKPEVHEDKLYGELDEEPKRFVKKNLKNYNDRKGKGESKGEDKGRRSKRDFTEEREAPEEMTLNKYIAHSGTCSRRDAAAMVKEGKVKVNGELVLDPGYRVKREDNVTLAGKKLKPTKDRAYILLNKPKGFLTTTDDPEGRRTVMELVENSGVDRLYPVGRLDRNTTGLLLLTNDGDLAQKLSHPSYNIKKVYQATLDKALTKADFEQILNGVQLEDGMAHVDALAYLDEKNEIGLEIHSGRNRIVRRIFEALGYEVEKLDRVVYAGLTKKNLPRGKWRTLSEKEIILLKHFKV